jgi:hypothetical protein
VLPHLIVFLLVVLYVLGGTALFQHFDPNMGKLPFYEVLLYAFTTLTTIGKRWAISVSVEF